jgi:hypothetical protein
MHRRRRSLDIPWKKIFLYSLGFIVLLGCAGAVGVGIYFTVKDQIKYPPTCVALPDYSTSNGTVLMYKDGSSSFRYIVTTLPTNATVGTIDIEDRIKTTGYTISMNTEKGQIATIRQPNGDTKSYVSSVSGSNSC